MQQDDGSTLDERRPIAPEAQRVTEPERGGTDRVQGLARQVQAFPRQWYDDRVERLCDDDAPYRGPAHQRLRMGDRGRPGQRRDGIEVTGRAGERAAPQHRG